MYVILWCKPTISNDMLTFKYVDMYVYTMIDIKQNNVENDF